MRRSLACGYQFSVCLDYDGYVWTFGTNSSGEMGQDSEICTFKIPTKNPHLIDIVSIDCGGNHVACLDSSGSVWTFGSNESYQLGFTTAKKSKTPYRVTELPPISEVHCGGYFTLCIDKLGSIWSFGLNGEGQLGRPPPNGVGKVEGFSGVHTVATGGNHTIFVDNSGKIFGFGYNHKHQLGLPIHINTKTPIEILQDLPDDVVSFACGWSFSLALLSNGDVYSFGLNEEGQCGFPKGSENAIVRTPTKIPDIPPIRSIEAGSSNSMLIDVDGNLWMIGSNKYGILGAGDDAVVKAKHLVLENVLLVSKGIGSIHTIAKDANNTIWGWSDNRFGNLGLGNQTSNNFLPRQLDSEYNDIIKYSFSTAKSARK